MQPTSKRKILGLAVGSLFAAASVFGTAGVALAEGPPGVPAPTPPRIPGPGEGLPVPIPGGGG